jgi:predicted nucleic acid-binding protein
MKYVLDSSVALKWVLPEADTAKALQLRVDFRNGVHELIAPDFFPIETAHALTRAERQRRIPQGSGWGLWQKIMSDCPTMLPWNVLMPRAFDLSSRMRVGVYDCVYIALAEQERCRVVTADQRLLNTFPAQTISLASVP